MHRTQTRRTHHFSHWADGVAGTVPSFSARGARHPTCFREQPAHCPLSLSLSPSLSPSLCLCHSVSLSLSLSVPPSLSPSVSLVLCLPLSFSISLCLSLSLSLCPPPPSVSLRSCARYFLPGQWQRVGDKQTSGRDAPLPGYTFFPPLGMQNLLVFVQGDFFTSNKPSLEISVLPSEPGERILFSLPF